MFNSIKGFYQLFSSVYQIMVNYFGYSRENELNPTEMCGAYPLSFFADNMTTFDLTIFVNNVNTHCTNHNYYFDQINHIYDNIYNYNQFCYRHTKMKVTIRRRIVINNNMRIVFYLSLFANNTIIDKRECHIMSVNSFSIDNYTDTIFKMTFKTPMTHRRYDDDKHSLYIGNITLRTIIEKDLSLFYNNINNWLYNQGWFNIYK